MAHKINADVMKQSNRKEVLRLIRKEPCSRVRLAERMGLTRASISFICEELLNEKMLVEGEKEESRGGRRGTILALNPAFGVYGGAYIRRTGYTVGVCDFSGAIKAEKQGKADKDDPKKTLERIVRDLKELLKGEENLLGVGIASPGPLDKQSGKLKKVANFSGWNGLALREYFEKEFSCRCELDNVSNALAKAEFSQNKNCGKRYLELIIDEGFGSAIAHVSGGIKIEECELGHASVDMNGKKCDCGNLGCAELFVNEGKYRGNDKERKEFYAALASAITSAANALFIRQVVFAGVVAEDFDRFEEKIRPELSKRGAEIELTETALSKKEVFVACNLVI